VLFLLQETRSGFSFGQMWPIILVVIGLISLASALSPMDGHISSSVPVAPSPGTVPGSTLPPQTPPQSYPGQGQ
jgi:hypothetical protein